MTGWTGAAWTEVALRQDMRSHLGAAGTRLTRQGPRVSLRGTTRVL
jgi:hypothetical protein